MIFLEHEGCDLTKDLRPLIWKRRLTAKLNVRYWRSYRQKYEVKEKAIKFLIAFTSSSAIASWALWAAIDPVWQSLTGIAALFAVASPILDYPKLIGKSGILYGRWVTMANDWETLWTDLELDCPVFVEKYHEVKDRAATLKADESDMPENRKLIMKCEQEVLQSEGLAR